MKLFKTRMLGHWQGIGLFLRRNLDFVSLLYVLVPSGLFTYFLLRETVFKVEYGVLERLHEGILIGLLMLISSFLKNRLFIEQADQLFLIQHPAFAQLKRWSYWYSLVLNVLVMGVVYSLLFPLLVIVHGFSSLQLVTLALAMLCSYVVCDTLDLWRRKWQKPIIIVFVLVLLTFDVLYASWWGLALIVLFTVGVIIYFERHMIRQHGYFQQQLELDLGRGSQFYAMLFSMNKDLQAIKMDAFHQKSPKSFKKLYATGQVPTLVELILKSIWRNRNYLRPLLQLVSIAVPLLILFPLWMKAVLIVFCYIGLSSFIESAAIEMKESLVFKLIPYQDADWVVAIEKTKRYVTLPVVAFYAVIVVVQLLFF